MVVRALLKRGLKRWKELIVEGLVVDGLELKKDSLVVGKLGLKKNFDGLISNLNPFDIHFVGDITNALSGFKTKGVRRRQWRIAWFFLVFDWMIIMLPLWI
ncbi:hypothetical protein L484_026902 [Morus notabilis]|uniref:Uncharacterized protein n=1 Tax=Morus notabilis TaxID=981085 RepID=W9RBH6_9ROSA|nr:hypothetical protein L484_026902 [Morus notabilis]